MKVVGWSVTAAKLPPREGSVDPTGVVYRDAITLLNRALTGRNWSRRRSGLADRRSRAAYALLQAAEIVVGGEVVNHDYPTYLFLLWNYHAQQTQLRNAKNYVSPHTPPHRKIPFVR